MPMTEEKRQPLLIDRVLAATPHDLGRDIMERRVIEHAQGRLKKAKPFLLDAQAVSRFAKVARELPDLVVQQQEFARAPYEVMWVEFDYTQFWSELRQDEPDETSDSLVGYLIDHDVVYAFAGGTRENPRKTPVMVPVRFKLHEPWTVESQMQFCQDVKTSRLQIDAWLWGEHAFYNLMDESRRSLRTAHTAELLFGPKFKNHLHEAFHAALVDGSSGDLRNIVTLLLLLNRPQAVRYVRSVDRGRGWVKGKMVPYFGYTTVTLDLDPEPVLRKIGTSGETQDELRRHEVRGHYRHDDAWKLGSMGLCEHTAVLDETSKHPDRSYRCSKCGGRKWWVPEFLRGNGAKGFIIKQYEVTASNEG